MLKQVQDDKAVTLIDGKMRMEKHKVKSMPNHQNAEPLKQVTTQAGKSLKTARLRDLGFLNFWLFYFKTQEQNSSNRRFAYR
ncbi:MAG: hypothetical protein EOP41_06995 [Sphingobacteriaceae bacterium]|nr:MAG: hypothetical protein EOP41_06995 [Sphingobacteriaceae bacterium]